MSGVTAVFDPFFGMLAGIVLKLLIGWTGGILTNWKGAYSWKDTILLEVVDVTRQLPIMQVSDTLCIASFVIWGLCDCHEVSSTDRRGCPKWITLWRAEAKGSPGA